MPSNSSLAIVFGSAAALLFFSGKKKRSGEVKSSSEEDPLPHHDKKNYIVPEYSESKEDEGVGQGTYIRFNDGCSGLSGTIDPALHNQWVTSKFHEIVNRGESDPSKITLEILIAQNDEGSPCPWDKRDAWTPFMESIYGQLLAAVSEYKDLLLEDS